MSQFDWGTIDPTVTDGVALADYLNTWKQAVVSNHSGPSDPPYALAGMLFTRVASDEYTVEVYNGEDFIPLISGNASTGQVTLGSDDFTLAFQSAGSLAFDNPVQIIPNGSETAPSLVIGSNTSTGFYNDGGTIFFTFNGAAAARFDASNGALSQPLSIVTREKGDARYVRKSGDTMTGFLTLNANPSNNLHAATKQYVDNQVSTGSFVSKSGDTMTGILTMDADIRLQTDRRIMAWAPADNAWRTLLYHNSGENVDILGAAFTPTVLRGQSTTVESTLTVEGVAAVQNRLIVEAGGGGNPKGFVNSHVPSGTMQFGSSMNADVHFQRNNETKLSLLPNWIEAYGGVRALSGTGGVTAILNANGNGGTVDIGSDSTHNVRILRGGSEIAQFYGQQMVFSNDYRIALNASGGSANNGTQMNASKGGTERFRVRNDGNVLNENNSYGALSDVSLKKNIEAMDPAEELARLLQLNPVRFDWINRDGGDEGFIAQEVQPHYPQIVSMEEEGLLSLAANKLIPHLVSSVKALKDENDELRARLSALESKQA